MAPHDAPEEALMTTAAVPIVNRAFGLLGQTAIADIDEDSTAAILAKAEYEPLVLEMIQGHDWNFASTRAALLVQVATPPPWGDSLLAYALPVDCLRVRATSLDGAEEGDRTPWQVEGRTLVTSADAVSIRYTARVLEALWPPAFATAVVFELACRLSYGITSKPSLAEGIEKRAARRLSVAKALDGQEGTPRRYAPPDVLTRVRG
jgi:hypothetical protein